MDITVHCTGNELYTDVYRTSTHTGRYLNYTSNHPNHVKTSVVHFLVNRMQYINLEETQTKDMEMTKIGDLLANGDPLAFLRKVSKK